MTPSLKTERPFSYHIGALLGHFCYRTMNNTNNTEYSIASKLSIRFLSAACRKAKCSTLYNWYLFSFLRTLTTWHCPHSPTTAAEHCAAINLCLLSAGLTAANLQQRVYCCGPRLGQTDGCPKDAQTLLCILRRRCL